MALIFAVARQSTHQRPDGIGDQHFDGSEGIRRHASVLSIAVIGALMAVALSGVLGGRFNDRIEDENGGARIAYVGPTIIRNGMFFEAHAMVHADRTINKPVLSVDESLMHDLTMNSMVPAAGEESYEDGAFRFTYDKLDQGDGLDVKFDFQINPSLMAGVAGKIAIYDDKVLLAEIPVELTVLP